MKKLPIILTTISSVMLTTSALAFSTYKQTNAEEQSITISVDTQISGQGVTTNTQNGNFTAYTDELNGNYTKLISTRIQTYKEDEYTRINVNNYTQTYNTFVDNQIGIQNNKHDASSCLFIYQITPYNSVNVTRTNLTISFALETGAPLTGSTRTLTISNIYQTTKSNIGQYMNLQNYTNENFANTKYQEITEIDVNKTKLYTESTESISVPTSNKQIQLNDVQIEQNRTTYIYGYLTYKVNYQNAPQNQTNRRLRASNLTIIGIPLPYVPQYEVINIWGLMLNILTMPFSFISTAFNVTIFEGTPYQFNISNILMSIIAICLLLWIIKLILGKANIGEFLGNQNAQYNNSKARKTAELNKKHEQEQREK